MCVCFVVGQDGPKDFVQPIVLTLCRFNETQRYILQVQSVRRTYSFNEKLIFEIITLILNDSIGTGMNHVIEVEVYILPLCHKFNIINTIYCEHHCQFGFEIIKCECF